MAPVFITPREASRDTGTIATAMAVSIGLVVNIITRIPTAVTTCDDLGQVLAQGVVHRVHIVGDGAEDFTLGMRVVIVQLQVVHLPVNITPQSLHNAGGQLSHAEALENGEKLGHKIKGYQRHEQPDDRFSRRSRFATPSYSSEVMPPVTAGVKR